MANGLGQFLTRTLSTNALVARFILKVKHQEYGSALATWDTLKLFASPETRGVLQQAVDRITVLRDSNEAVTTSESIPDDRTAWHDNLFKKRFAIAVKSGAVSEIKLRCQRKYLLFHYEPDVQYSVGPQAGACAIEVVGNPGTTFDLTQS